MNRRESIRNAAALSGAIVAPALADERGPAAAPSTAQVAFVKTRDRAAGVALLRHFGTTPEVSRGAIFDQEQIAGAVQLGLGVTGPDGIELVTGDADSAAYATRIRAVLDGAAA